MKRKLITIGIAAVVGIAVVALYADEHRDEYETHEREDHEEQDRDGDHERREHSDELGTRYLADPQYALYESECGDCHMAYPPPFLPAASWDGVMSTLEDHFGDNAELDSATSEEITAFLSRYSAERANGKYGERMWRATRHGTPPLRIADTDYFRGQHHEIPAKMASENPDVVSYSRCEVCHGGADRGSFDEHEVRIPGYGRWDD